MNKAKLLFFICAHIFFMGAYKKSSATGLIISSASTKIAGLYPLAIFNDWPE